MKPIAIGRVRTSFGLDGSVKVLSYSGETKHFLGIQRVEVRSKQTCNVMQVERVRASGNTPIVKFVGIDTPEAAKNLRGAELWVDRTHAAPLGENEYYVADLVGMSLVYEGTHVGAIRAVVDGLNGSLLEIDRDGDGTVLVPFGERFVGDVDADKRTLELLVDWILE